MLSLYSVSQLPFITSRFFSLISPFLFCLVLATPSITFANTTNYQVQIETSPKLKNLLENHLDLNKWLNNPRMTPTEWERLTQASPAQIRALLATEGYFSPNIQVSSTHQQNLYIAHLKVLEGEPTLIKQVEIQFKGQITEVADKNLPNPATLKSGWLLKSGMQFTQEAWSQAKRSLLSQLLVSAYPNATIATSKATIDPVSNTASLLVEIDSANVVYFGDLEVNGLNRYPESIVRNLNPIKPGRVYHQDQLLLFQTRLQESSYFKTADVTALTQQTDATAANKRLAPIKVTVEENPAIKLTTGLGFSTNTGARSQLTVDHLNLFNRSWRTSTSLRLEQRLQALSGTIRFPTTPEGYRDSVNATANQTEIEGQRITTTEASIKRAWGPRKREQYIGANFINEHINLDGAESSDNYAATLTYGITLRRTDNDLNPKRGYLFTAQFAGAPFDALSNGSFLQTYLKTQAYYPITLSTQLIARGELGMVNGKNSAPAAFLFRAGGDQSVRGYGYQSLGITEGDAIVGGRYLVTGSLEVVQWLTHDWGAALFVDAGNAANEWKALKPVYGYGLGARWKSPVGPIGADIAYGQETDDYRMHFNIGVVF